ncbi:MAG: tetratricopeptide repeat protein [Candidatus Electronema sp. VV]
MSNKACCYREIRCKEGEGWSLNNIGEIYRKHGDYAVALEYYNQALAISREIKDKRMEITCLNNIGMIYKAQENYDAALEQFKQSLMIIQQIGDDETRV